MEVKGTAFLARKVMLIEEIGQERYAQFLAEFAEQEPFFRQPISATTLIPIGAFIAFNEVLVSTFYGGDVRSYLQFGEKSADYALIFGPFKRIRETHSIAAFVDSARVIYQGYYTAGRAEGSLEGQTAELRVIGIPSEHKHLYFEYVIVAFFRRGIELTGAHSVTMTRVLGFSNGDDEIRYRYSIEETVLPDPRSRRWSP
jgi:hypothetical protein